MAKFSLLITHYFDTNALHTGFKSLSQADWLFFSKTRLDFQNI